MWFFPKEFCVTVVENLENISLLLATVITVCAHMRIAVLFKCVSAYSVAFCLYKLYWRTRIKKESMNWFFFQMLLPTDSFCCKFFICSSPSNHNCLSSLEMWRLYSAWQGSGLKIVVKVRNINSTCLSRPVVRDVSKAFHSLFLSEN